jgi:hypothetical protein
MHHQQQSRTGCILWQMSSPELTRCLHGPSPKLFPNRSILCQLAAGLRWRFSSEIFSSFRSSDMESVEFFSDLGPVTSQRASLTACPPSLLLSPPSKLWQHPLPTPCIQETVRKGSYQGGGWVKIRRSQVHSDHGLWPTATVRASPPVSELITGSEPRVEIMFATPQQ